MGCSGSQPSAAPSWTHGLAHGWKGLSPLPRCGAVLCHLPWRRASGRQGESWGLLLCLTMRLWTQAAGEPLGSPRASSGRWPGPRACGEGPPATAGVWGDSRPAPAPGLLSGGPRERGWPLGAHGAGRGGTCRGREAPGAPVQGAVSSARAVLILVTAPSRLSRRVLQRFGAQ